MAETNDVFMIQKSNKKSNSCFIGVAITLIMMHKVHIMDTADCANCGRQQQQD